MSINASYKYLNKNQSAKPGAAPNLSNIGFSPVGSQNASSKITNYHAGNERLKNATNFNSTIKEVTGEMFYTKYGQNQFGKNRTTVEGRENVQQFTVDDSAKCICFCQQRLGR